MEQLIKVEPRKFKQNNFRILVTNLTNGPLELRLQANCNVLSFTNLFLLPSGKPHQIFIQAEAASFVILFQVSEPGHKNPTKQTFEVKMAEQSIKPIKQRRKVKSLQQKLQPLCFPAVGVILALLLASLLFQ